MFCIPGFEFFANHLSQSPYNYLEIGVFNGDSIGHLARHYSAKTVFGIDPFIEDGCTTHTSGVTENEYMSAQHENTLKNIDGLDNVVLFTMTSKEFNDILTDEMIADMDVGWVLIDGSHHYEDVINDAHMAMRLIGKRAGAIIFDDLNIDGVKQAHDEFVLAYAGQISTPVDIYEMHPGHIVAYYINH